MDNSKPTSKNDATTRFRKLIRDYRWIHLGLGLIGNTAFVIGSVFLFWSWAELPSIWLFVAGSSGMWIGSVGECIVKYEEAREKARAEGRQSVAR
jgi:hypothetical protein